MRNDGICIRLLPGTTPTCPWHKQHQETGKIYQVEELFPSKICPVLFHTLYPYFLGALYGAKYTYNKEGDCHVCCPAEKGIDLLVKVRPNDGKFESWVPSDWRDVIHAEVVKVNGKCDYAHSIGDRFVFPTCAKTVYACPAGINNLFPFLRLETLKCINLHRLRCPDWLENVYYSLGDEAKNEA